MFFRGGQRAGFRPRSYNSGRFQFLMPLVVGMVSGYYIFNEPLKQAAMEVKAKAAQEGASTEAARGGGTSTSISNNTSNGSGSSGSSSSSSIRGSDGKTRANGGGDVSNEGIPRN